MAASYITVSLDPEIMELLRDLVARVEALEAALADAVLLLAEQKAEMTQ